MKLFNAVVPRMRRKYGLTLDMTIEEALSRITLEEDREVFLEAMKYPNGNWRKGKNGYIRIVKGD